MAKRVTALLTSLDSSVGTNTWYGPGDSGPRKTGLLAGPSTGSFRPSEHTLQAAERLADRRHREAEVAHVADQRRRLEDDRAKLEREAHAFKQTAAMQAQAQQELMASGKAQLVAEAEARIKALHEEVTAMEQRAQKHQHALAERDRQLSEREAQFIAARQQREKEEQARSAHEADQQKAMWEKLRREAAEEQQRWRAELEQRDRREREAFFQAQRAELQKEFEAREALRRKEEERVKQFRMQAALHSAPVRSSFEDRRPDYVGRDGHRYGAHQLRPSYQEPRGPPPDFLRPRQPGRSVTFADLPSLQGFNRHHTSPEDPLYAPRTPRHAYSRDDLSNPWLGGGGSDADHFAGFGRDLYGGLPFEDLGSRGGRPYDDGLSFDGPGDRDSLRSYSSGRGYDASPSPPFGYGAGGDPFSGPQPGMDYRPPRRSPLSLSDEALDSFNCVTTDTVPGFQTLHIIGPVHGSAVRPIRSESRDPRYLEQQRRATADDRRHAIRQLIEQAVVQGANAVVGLHFDTSAPVSPYEAEIVAYGTAVLLKPAPMDKSGGKGGEGEKKDGKGKPGEGGGKGGPKTFAELAAQFNGPPPGEKGGKDGKDKTGQQQDGKKGGKPDDKGSIDIDQLQAFLNKQSGGKANVKGGGGKGKQKAEEEEEGDGDGDE